MIRFSLRTGPNLNSPLQRTAWKGVALLVVDLSLYFSFVMGTILAEQIWLKLLFGLGSGVMISLLAIVGHDAGHQSFSDSRVLNRLCGTLAFLPALHPFSLWKYHHNLIHHRYTTQLGIDNAFPPMSVAAYKKASLWSQRKYRFIRGLWGQPFFYLIEIWIPAMLLPFWCERRTLNRTDWLDLAIVYAFFVVYLILIISASSLFHGLHGVSAVFSPLVFSWAIPFLIWNSLISFLSIVQHTAPAIRWFLPTGRPTPPQQALAGTIHVVFPEWFDRLTHRIFQHPAHHLHERIPLYQLKSAQQNAQLNHPQYLGVCWSLPYHLRITRECQLYDPEAHRWCRFEDVTSDA